MEETLEVIPHNHMADRAQVMDHIFRKRKHRRTDNIHSAQPVLPWVLHAGLGASGDILATIDQWKSFQMPGAENVKSSDTPAEVIYRPSLKFWHVERRVS